MLLEKMSSQNTLPEPCQVALCSGDAFVQDKKEDEGAASPALPSSQGKGSDHSARACGGPRDFLSTGTTLAPGLRDWVLMATSVGRGGLACGSASPVAQPLGPQIRKQVQRFTAGPGSRAASYCVDSC